MTVVNTSPVHRLVDASTIRQLSIQQCATLHTHRNKHPMRKAGRQQGQAIDAGYAVRLFSLMRWGCYSLISIRLRLRKRCIKTLIRDRGVPTIEANSSQVPSFPAGDFQALNACYSVDTVQVGLGRPKNTDEKRRGNESAFL
jgi:hypothetical protein